MLTSLVHTRRAAVAVAAAGARGARAVRALSTVADATVRITFIDHDGNRATVPGRVGQSLFEVARMHKIGLEGPCLGGGSADETPRTERWIEDTYGEGPSCYYCHVQIPKQWHSVLPYVTKVEHAGLADFWEEEANSSSRLACTINLSKDMEGMTVFIPDGPPSDIL